MDDASNASTEPRRLGRSVAAILIGFVSVVALSLITDQLLHVMHVYPPWGQPMFETSLNVLGLSYRCVFAALGSYIAAVLAPRAPMGHAMILGVLGVVAGTAGVFATKDMNLGPMWYPVSLPLTALPCAWLGGIMQRVLSRTNA